ncbi:hypothetical protein BKA61DRAFT_682441 [Leptodontidium sp. MPI-SDFR-AT-0119]|nr:hypothetical protein BKA61DRAFT_682441 [Leptodontidium sp. MPI-SDFR-AT-0119]
MQEDLARLPVRLASNLDGARNNDLWARAVEKLSLEDKTTINFSFDKLSILSDLKAETEAAQLKCEERRLGFRRRNGEKVILRDVLGKVAKWISLFKEVGDVVVSYDPGHAALPWALVRFILQASIGDLEKYDFVVENLEIVSRSICRCRIVQQLYLDRHTSAAKDELELTLVKLYGAILLYLSKAKSFLERKKSPLLDSITSDLQEVDEYAHLIAREDDSSRYSELNRILLECEAPLKRLSNQLQGIQDNLTDTKRRTILDWMSDTTKLPYLKHHKENKRQILKGTGEWLLNDEMYKKWKDDSASSLLWLHGIPGSGKSKLTSLVIEDAFKLSAQGLIPRPAIFYCSQNTAEPLRADPTSILASIARQLASLNPSSALLPPVVELYEETEAQGSASGTLDIDDSKELILALIDVYPVTTIIIDALDECCANERGVILDFLKTVIEESSSLVRIFISSREDGDIVFHLDRFPNMRISSGKNQVDIEAFVASETARLVRFGYLLRNSTRQMELAEEIASRVASQASGMFRWASLQLQNLTEMKTDADICNRLGRNPPSLEELYLEIYNRIASSQQFVSSRIAQNAFSLLLGMKTELKPDCFLTLVQFEDEVPTATQLLDICCNLVVFDETAKVFHFAHLSVREFLESLPVFSRARTHLDISLCALRQVADWNRAGLEIWSWNFRELGRYINKYLRFHLEEAGGQNRLIALRQGLWSLLDQGDLSTLDGPEGNLSIRWRVPKPPTNTDISYRCLFNAGALNFTEIVKYLLDGCSDQGAAPDKDIMSPELRFSADGSGLRYLFRVCTPDVHFELVKHAIRCGATAVLSELLDRTGPDTFGPNFALEAASSAFVEETTCMEVLMDRFGLSCISTETILRAVSVGFGNITPFTSEQSRFVQGLVQRGLHFHVDPDFLSSVEFLLKQNSGLPPSNGRWFTETFLLLVDTDEGCELSVEFVKMMIRQASPSDQQLLRMLSRCELQHLVQTDFVFIARNCKFWEPIDLMLTSGVISPPNFDFFLDILAWRNGEYLLQDLLNREDGHDIGREVFTQNFLESLAASSADREAIITLLSSGLEITNEVLFSACTEVQPGMGENDKFWWLLYEVYSKKDPKVLDRAQDLLEKAAKNGQWEGFRYLLTEDESLVVTEDIVLLAANREQSQWGGYAAAEKRIETLQLLKKHTDSKACLQILGDAIAKPCEIPGYKIVTQEGYTFVVKEQTWTTKAL